MWRCTGEAGAQAQAQSRREGVGTGAGWSECSMLVKPGVAAEPIGICSEDPSATSPPTNHFCLGTMSLHVHTL